ncbi:Flp family type IVb pilin [Aeromicrobium terrae]|jgi:pilus assembly protein Flp/PilA|uniref:Flp family type IVb pilin n=1 Tax=Aeromicrobium terrae TaxID=2498846 RepID=A0A5C8NLV4_9ACTN|nr:Flp family type IVb pilin [Aeromicrobium terrae]TXL62126.1 Flp family type IVb pilin [Aeromicrobium terrae]
MFSHALAYVLSVLAAPKRDEEGATAVEYALVVGLVSLVVVAAVALFGPKIETFVNGVSFS